LRLKKSFLLNIVLALGVASLIFFFSQKGVFKRLELTCLDLSFRLRGAITCNPRIVITEITDSDILKIGRWPWERVWHAAIIRALSDLGAKHIYFDIMFSESSSEEDDQILQEAISLSKKVYLPFVFQNHSLDIKNALLPIERFSSSLKGTGAINIYPDIDGTIRRIPLIFLGEENLHHPHAALKIAMDYKALAIKEINPRYLLLSNSKEEVKIPLLKKNEMLINWTGKWQDTFKHYRFLDVLAGYKDLLENREPKINLDDFKDSICLIGITAIGLYDIKPVPLQPEYPAIGIVANAISNILNKNFLYSPPAWINILILYLLTLMPAFLIFGERPLRETIFVFSAAAFYFLMNLLLFRKGIVIGFTYPLLGLFTSYLVVETYNFVRIAVERQSFFKMSIIDGLTGLYNVRYFKMLTETEIMLAKTDPDMRFSIIMSDIDHFKHLNDTYGHQIGDLVLKEVAMVLKNSVRSSDIVARYGGEEMIVLLRGSSLKDALEIAEKIRKNTENHLIKDQYNTYKATISLGVSDFRPQDNVETIIKRADKALYKAKSLGRNRVEVEFEGKIDEITGLYKKKTFQ